MKSPISQKPNRKSLRLKHFDYSQNSYYFITICTKNKQNFFGKIDKDKIILNEIAQIVQERWRWLQENF
jgi:putative transposase